MQKEIKAQHDKDRKLKELQAKQEKMQIIRTRIFKERKQN